MRTLKNFEKVVFDFTKKVSFREFCVHTLVGLPQGITGARAVPSRCKHDL